MGNAQIQYALALSIAEKIGNITYKKLTEKFGSAQSVFEESMNRSIPHKSILSSSVLDQKQQLLAEASTLLTKHQEKKIAVIPYEDERYPAKLRHIYSPPSVLYSSCSINLNKHKTIAIVGTRKPSAYGKKFVHQLIASLKKYQPTIVSGLAYGIDICAHKAALANEIPTIGVVAGGLNRIYPYEHAKEASMINQQGCLISEHPLDIQPEKHHFPQRNRIIAGMCDAVVVIEAGHKSGALITAKYANESNTEVFALPGDVYSSTSEGCNHLIKTHQAHILTCAEDIAYMMDWDTAPNNQKDQPTFISLNPKEDAIVGVLKTKSPIHLDTLSNKVQLDVGTLTNLTLQLEMKQCVSQISANCYALA